MRHEGEVSLYGSYSANLWLYPHHRSTEPSRWSTSARGKPDVPVLVEWVNTIVLPYGTEVPPDGDGLQWWEPATTMQACIDRHRGAINGLFMDWSVRKVGLKELWTLKWHRRYDAKGPWTKAGGALPGDWPPWMWGFKDY